jgi:hypothetical protein
MSHVIWQSFDGRETIAGPVCRYLLYNNLTLIFMHRPQRWLRDYLLCPRHQGRTRYAFDMRSLKYLR